MIIIVTTATPYKMINIIGRVFSNLVPSVYFLLFLNFSHSSLNGVTGSFFGKSILHYMFPLPSNSPFWWTLNLLISSFIFLPEAMFLLFVQYNFTYIPNITMEHFTNSHQDIKRYCFVLIQLRRNR